MKLTTRLVTCRSRQTSHAKGTEAPFTRRDFWRASAIFQLSRPQPPAQPDQMNNETDRSQQKQDKLFGSSNEGI